MIDRPDKPGGNGEASEGYGAVPYRMFAAGLFAGLTRAEAMVYLALAAHVNGKRKDWLVWPGERCLVDGLGLDPRTVGRALRRLRERGLIVPEQLGGGKGHKTRWRIVENPGEASRVSEGETPAPESTNPGTDAPLSTKKTPAPESRNPGNPVQETPARRSRNPGAPVPQENREGTEKRTEQQQQPAAAGFSTKEPEAEAELERKPTDPNVEEALVESGIGEPKRSELAKRLSGLCGAVATIRERAETLKAQRKGTGILVNELETWADAQEAQKRTRQRDAGARRAAEAQRAAREQQDAERIEAGQRWLAGLAPEEFTEAVRQYKQAGGRFMQSTREYMLQIHGEDMARRLYRQNGRPR